MKTFFALSFVLLAGSNAIDIPKPAEKPHVMPTQKIIGCIQRIAGLDVVSPIEKTEEVSLSEVNLPFFSSRLKGQTGIRVRLTPTKVKWLPAVPIADNYMRHFTIYLDENADRVLMVTVRLAERSPDVREPSSEKAEMQLRKNNETYSSFPDIRPKVNFMEVLEILRTVGVASPNLAQEIDGTYLMYSRMKETPHPVWVITMRGLPPFPVRHPVLPESLILRDPPAWKRNYMREVVDAISGRWIFSSNSPKPD